jgi:hypothetical protein
MPKPIDLNKPAGPLPTAPAAKPIRSMPLPTGAVHRAGAQDTAASAVQKANLAGSGWQVPGLSQVSPAIRAAAAAVRREAEIEAQEPPVPLDTPPLEVKTVDISQLDPGSRARITQVLQETQMQRPAPRTDDSIAAQGAAVRAVMAQQQRRHWQEESQFQSAVAEAQAGPPGTAAFHGLVQPRGVKLGPEVEIDIPPAARDLPPEPLAEAPPPAAEEELPSAGSAGPGECPHCGHDLSQPDIPEPGYTDKQAFLQSVLGQKPFLKSYELFDGAMVVVFRTLTTKEMDLVYLQVLKESKDGLIPSALDYWEKINRYRRYLQIARMETPGLPPHDLPDGFTKESNPYATAHWSLPPPKDPMDTGLPLVADYVMAHIFRTESIERCVGQAAVRFNKLVARLEALMDNSDFWRRTGAPS